MNKLINWTLGSFFRTLGRFLFYIIITLLLSYLLKDIKLPGLFDILNVEADSNDAWFYNIENYGSTQWYWYNHTSSGYSETTGYLDSRSLYYENVELNGDPQLRYYEFPALSNANIHTNGVSISYYVNQIFAQGYLYNLTSYVCFSSSNVNNIEPSVSTGYSAINAINHSMGYHVSVKTKLNNVTAPLTIDTLSNCYAITSLISSTGSYPWVNLRFKNSTNINTAIIFIGYDIEALGIYNASLQQYVQNAINNSGLASASSISQVQSSVNQVQQELDDVNTSIENQTAQQQQNHDELMDNLNDDDTSQSTNSASNFFSNFNTNTHGLTGIITAPLSAIQSLTSSTCTPLVIPLPFVNENLTLPCMRSIYTQYFGGFMQLYDIITLGIISYWVMVRIFGLVKDFKNPEHDEIEVVDL